MRPHGDPLLVLTVPGSPTKGTEAEAEKAMHGRRVFCASHCRMWYVPTPELLKHAHRDTWDEKFNRAIPEMACYAATHCTCSGVAAPKKN